MRAVFTTTDLIFTDEITDDFLALDANDGKILYKHHVGGPIAAGDELRFGRQAVSRRRLELCRRLLQPDGSQERRRKLDNHSLRTDTVAAGPRPCAATPCDRRATAVLCPRHRFRSECRRA